jgi:hypothetical protein
MATDNELDPKPGDEEALIIPGDEKPEPEQEEETPETETEEEPEGEAETDETVAEEPEKACRTGKARREEENLVGASPDQLKLTNKRREAEKRADRCTRPNLQRLACSGKDSAGRYATEDTARNCRC